MSVPSYKAVYHAHEARQHRRNRPHDPDKQDRVPHSSVIKFCSYAEECRSACACACSTCAIPVRFIAAGYKNNGARVQIDAR
ncbi:hypothetical protein LJR255_000325 [Pararhizobium sp. LjRoot255]|uniref:hypothetical protein n=1 Tax=Pararhizobium sp. LjRoot255 TaxID=3342298 RepID=UPI003ECDA9CD